MKRPLEVTCRTQRPRITSRRGPAAWVLGVGLAVFVLVPSQAHAATITALTLVIGGISLTADLLGIGGTLVDIFGAGDIGTQSDDHPLYTLGASSPSLTISATETTFDLLLQQSNNVGEAEDDLAAVLSGTTKIDAPGGMADAWKWKITLEAEVPTLFVGCSNGVTDLEAQGFVQHVRAPHPDLGEVPIAPGLDYNLKVAKASTGTILCTWAQSVLTDTDTDSRVHPNGKHKDVLDPAKLEADCCTTFNGEIDSFSLRLTANHVPEPAAYVLLSTGLLAVLSRMRRAKRRLG